MNPEIIGSLAAFFTTVAYIPQAIKVFREKNTKGISIGMYLFITTGIALWFIYGVMIGSPSLMVTNSVTFVLSASILLMKIKHG